MKERIKWNLILSSVLYFLLGLVLTVWPDGTSLALAYCVGVATLLYGIFDILAHFLHKGREGLHLELAAGILAGAFGLFTLFQPTAILSVLPIALGLLIVVNSVASLRRSFSLRRLGFACWWVTLLMALAVLMLGILAIFRPFQSFTLLLRVIGIVLLYSCVSDLWMMHQVTVLTKSAIVAQPAPLVDVPFKEVSDDDTRDNI